MELEEIGRTVGRGATLGFCFRASMTPVIVAMFRCNCLVVAMWQRIVMIMMVLVRVVVVVMEWKKRRKRSKGEKTEGKKRN